MNAARTALDIPKQIASEYNDNNNKNDDDGKQHIKNYFGKSTTDKEETKTHTDTERILRSGERKNNNDNDDRDECKMSRATTPKKNE